MTSCTFVFTKAVIFTKCLFRIDCNQELPTIDPVCWSMICWLRLNSCNKSFEPFLVVWTFHPGGTLHLCGAEISQIHTHTMKRRLSSRSRLISLVNLGRRRHLERLSFRVKVRNTFKIKSDPLLLPLGCAFLSKAVEGIHQLFQYHRGVIGGEVLT
jgi:hypothetical protein